jgi:hypothetical protein
LGMGAPPAQVHARYTALELVARTSWLQEKITPLETELKSLVTLLESRDDSKRDKRDLYVLVKTYADFFSAERNRAENIGVESVTSFKNANYSKLYSLYLENTGENNSKAIQFAPDSEIKIENLVLTLKLIQEMLEKEKPGFIDSLKQSFALSTIIKNFRNQIHGLFQSEGGAFKVIEEQVNNAVPGRIQRSQLVTGSSSTVAPVGGGAGSGVGSLLFLYSTLSGSNPFGRSAPSANIALELPKGPIPKKYQEVALSQLPSVEANLEAATLLGQTRPLIGDRNIGKREPVTVELFCAANSGLFLSEYHRQYCQQKGLQSLKLTNLPADTPRASRENSPSEGIISGTTSSEEDLSLINGILDNHPKKERIAFYKTRYLTVPKEAPDSENKRKELVNIGLQNLMNLAAGSRLLARDPEIVEKTLGLKPSDIRDLVEGKKDLDLREQVIAAIKKTGYVRKVDSKLLQFLNVEPNFVANWMYSETGWMSTAHGQRIVALAWALNDAGILRSSKYGKFELPLLHSVTKLLGFPLSSRREEILSGQQCISFEESQIVLSRIGDNPNATPQILETTKRLLAPFVAPQEKKLEVPSVIKKQIVFPSPDPFSENEIPFDPLFKTELTIYKHALPYDSSRPADIDLFLGNGEQTAKFRETSYLRPLAEAIRFGLGPDATLDSFVKSSLIKQILEVAENQAYTKKAYTWEIERILLTELSYGDNLKFLHDLVEISATLRFPSSDRNPQKVAELNTATQLWSQKLNTHFDFLVSHMRYEEKSVHTFFYRLLERLLPPEEFTRMTVKDYFQMVPLRSGSAQGEYLARRVMALANVVMKYAPEEDLLKLSFIEGLDSDIQEHRRQIIPFARMILVQNNLGLARIAPKYGKISSGSRTTAAKVIEQLRDAKLFEGSSSFDWSEKFDRETLNLISDAATANPKLKWAFRLLYPEIFR